MVIAPAEKLITAEQFLIMPESEGHELLDGRIVEVPMGAESSWVGGELYRRIANFVIEKGLGRAFPQETGVRIWPDRPNHVRKPDILFIKRGRLDLPFERGWLTVVPDLVVEVVSPNDSADALETKLLDYQRAGIGLIWVVYPESQTAHVLRRGRPRVELSRDAALDGEDVLPGFMCSLDELLSAAEKD